MNKFGSETTSIKAIADGRFLNYAASSSCHDPALVSFFKVMRQRKEQYQPILEMALPMQSHTDGDQEHKKDETQRMPGLSIGHNLTTNNEKEIESGPKSLRSTLREELDSLQEELREEFADLVEIPDQESLIEEFDADAPMTPGYKIHVCSENSMLEDDQEDLEINLTPDDNSRGSVEWLETEMGRLRTILSGMQQERENLELKIKFIDEQLLETTKYSEVQKEIDQVSKYVNKALNSEMVLWNGLKSHIASLHQSLHSCRCDPCMSSLECDDFLSDYHQIVGVK